MNFTQLSSDPSMGEPKLSDSKLAARCTVPEPLFSKVLNQSSSQIATFQKELLIETTCSQLAQWPILI